MYLCFVFKQKTAYEMRISDWSSDVCSSDLCAVDGPAVQGDQLIIRHHVLRGIEAVEIREQEACGVADTTVGIGAALQDLLGYRHLAGIVGGRDPPTQDVGAHAVGNFLRRDDVAEGQIGSAMWRERGCQYV